MSRRRRRRRYDNATWAGVGQKSWKAHGYAGLVNKAVDEDQSRPARWDQAKNWSVDGSKYRRCDGCQYGKAFYRDE